MTEQAPDHSPVPQISIVTPCYNAGRFIRRTIESVRDQEGVSVEHIVVDGDSTDDTVEILKSYPHLRWVSEPDEGQADAFNKGLALARAPLIGWLNADDVYEPGALARVVDCFRRHPEAGIVNGGLVRVDADDHVVETWPARFRPFYLVHFWFGWYGLNHPASFYRRALFDAVGPVDAALHYAMDYDFYLRASRATRIVDLDVPTSRMLVHPEAKTSRGVEPFARDLRRTLAKVWWPRNRLFFVYTLAGLAAHAARAHLVESFVALRGGEGKRARQEFASAVRWWPPIPLLPSFYVYLARVGARLVLGEARYAGLRKNTSR